MFLPYLVLLAIFGIVAFVIYLILLAKLMRNLFFVVLELNYN